MTSVSVEDIKVDREKAVKRTLDLVNVKSPTGKEVETSIKILEDINRCWRVGWEEGP
jgi:hypothetical protein